MSVCLAGAFFVSAGTAPAQPANDNCSDAIPISNGATPFNTTGANTDGPAHGSCEFDGQTYHDIWYTYTATCTGDLTVSTCNSASYDSDLVVYDGCDCGNLVLLGCNDDGSQCGGFTSEVEVTAIQDSCYLIRVGGWQSGDQGAGTLNITCVEPGQQIGACCLDEETCTVVTLLECQEVAGDFLGQGTLCSPNPCSASVGPDVLLSDSTNTTNYGAIGGIRAYALGSNTCNIGSQDLLWLFHGTPGLAMNAYRLHDGRLEQIGMGWVKTACCAAAGGGCGLPCNGHNGSVLGAGCLDVYSASWNGGQGRLAPRSGINGFTGTFDPIPPGSGDAIWRRLQIAETDLNSTNFPGATYFIEGEYVAPDDASAGNQYNNASYKRVNIGASFNLNVAGSMAAGVPAIFAWRDHGGGIGIPDPSVEILPVDVPNEGRFYFASKATDLGGGQWRYDYGVFNLNSHRSGGSFSVPIPSGAAVSNVTFKDVPYHSGDPYDNTNWSSSVSGTSVSWASPETFDQNPNSNALRWGTMYNFGFQADVAPATVEVTLGLFIPGGAGDPASVATLTTGPAGGVPPCALLGDINGDTSVNGPDIAGFVRVKLGSPAPEDNAACADYGTGTLAGDMAAFVADLLP